MTTFKRLELHSVAASVEMYQEDDKVIFETYRQPRPVNLSEVNLFIKFSMRHGLPDEIVEYGGIQGEALRNATEVTDVNARLKMIMEAAVRSASRIPGSLRP